MRRPPINKACARKAIALGLCTAMLASDVYASALPADLSFRPSVVPSSLGHIESSYPAASEKKIIYILDAHDSLQAQKNIAGLISHLVETEGVRTVYEEGFEGPVPTDRYFRGIEDPLLRAQTAYQLMDSLRLGGAEFAHITRTRDFRLIGADNQKLHLKNIDDFRRASEVSETVMRDLTMLESQFRRLVEAKFPAEAKDFLALRARFQAKTLDLRSYLFRLRKLTESFPAASGFERHFPQTALLLSSFSLPKEAAAIERLNARELLKEIESLEKSYIRSALRDETNFQVFDFLAAIERFEKLCRLELSYEEYEAVKAGLRPGKTREAGEFLAKTLNKPLVLRKQWEADIQAALDFYETANARHGALERKLREFQNSAERTAVLVFGGFHRKAVEEFLRSQKIAYEIVIPAISEADPVHRERYRSLMAAGYDPKVSMAQLARASRYPPLFVDGALAGESGVQKQIGILSRALQDALSVRSELRTAEERLEKFFSEQGLGSLKPPEGLDLELAASALLDKKIQLDRLPAPQRDFLSFLKENKLASIVLMGGAVKDAFFNREPRDLDISVSFNLSEYERVISRPLQALAPERIFLDAQHHLARLSRAMNVPLSSLNVLGSDPRAARFNGTTVHYFGPVAARTSEGKTLYIKQFFADRNSSEVFYTNSGASVLKLAVDAEGNVYGDPQALIGLLQGKARIAGEGKNFGAANILRLLRLKYELDLEIPEEDRKKVLAASAQEKGELSETALEIIRNIRETAVSPDEAIKEIISLGLLDAAHPLAAAAGRSELRGGMKSALWSIAAALALSGPLALPSSSYAQPPQRIFAPKFYGDDKEKAIDTLIGQGSAESLAKLVEMGSPALDRLNDWMFYGTTSQKIHAVKALGHFKSQRAVQILKSNMNDPSIVKPIIDALIQIKDGKALSGVLPHHNVNKEERMKLIAVLAEAGDETASDALVKRWNSLEAGDNEEREALKKTFTALAKRGLYDDEALSTALQVHFQARESGSAEDARWAAEILSLYGDEAEPLLTGLLLEGVYYSGERELRIIRYFGETGGVEAAEALLKRWRQSKFGEREEISEEIKKALAAIADRNELSTKALIEAMETARFRPYNSADPDNIQWAADALLKRGSPAIPELAEALENASLNNQIHLKIIEILGQIEDPAVIPILKKAKAGNPDYQEAVLSAFEKMEAFPDNELSELLKSSVREERASGVRIVGLTKNTARIPELLEILEFESEWSASTEDREAVLEAFKHMKDPATVPPLIEAYEKVTELYSFKGKLLDTLIEIGDPRVIPLLAEGLGKNKLYEDGMRKLDDPQAKFYVYLLDADIEKAAKIESSSAYARNALASGDAKVRKGAKEVLRRNGDLNLWQQFRYLWNGWPFWTAVGLFIGVYVLGIAAVYAYFAAVQWSRIAGGLLGIDRYQDKLAELIRSPSDPQLYSKSYVIAVLAAYKNRLSETAENALLRELQAGRLPEKLAAAKGLAGVTRETVIWGLIKVLADNRLDVRVAAVKSLKASKSAPAALFATHLLDGGIAAAAKVPGAYSYALRLLDHTKLPLRNGAIQVLALLGDPAAIPRLDLFLTDTAQTAESRVLAARAMHALGATSEGTSFVAALNSDSSQLRAAVKKILSKLADPQAVFYTHLLKGKYTEAAGMPGSLDYATTAAASGHIRIRRAAAKVLVILNDERAALSLGPIVTNEAEDEMLRVIAARALHGKKSGVADLIAGLASDSKEIREASGTALDSIDDPRARVYAALFFKRARVGPGDEGAARQYALEALSHANPAIRAQAGTLLAVYPSTEAVPQLVTALADVEPEVRKSAHAALGRTKSGKAKYYELLYRGDSAAAAAVDATGAFTLEALDHDNADLRRAAVSVCAILKSEDFVADLFRIWGQERNKPMADFILETIYPLYSEAALAKRFLELSEALVRQEHEIRKETVEEYGGMYGMDVVGTREVDVSHEIGGPKRAQAEIEIIQIMKQIGEKKLRGMGPLVAKIITNHMDRTAAAIQAISTAEALDEPSAVPLLMEALKSNQLGDAAGTALAGYLKKAMKKSPAEAQAIIRPLIAKMKAVEGDKKAAERAFTAFAPAARSLFTEEQWRETFARYPVSVFANAYVKDPEFFNESISWLNVFRKLIQAVEDEVAGVPPAQRDAARAGLINNIASYFGSSKGGDIAEAISRDAPELASLLAVVHDNFGLVTSSMQRAGLNAVQIGQLRRVLPLNNPLTRIIRMLGESRSTVGGYLEVVQRIRASNSFDKFYGILLEIASLKQRSAPQEIAGILEILQAVPDFKSWTSQDWEELRRQIDRYYSQGFKVITFSLFDYFRKHEHDEQAMKTMKADIENQLSNVAWGGFLGLTEKFKNKYGLTTEDEIALLVKYLSVSNLTTRDYRKKYEEIKASLQKRGERWQQEVDPALRGLYRTTGSRAILVYQPKEKTGFDRDASHEKLASYASRAGAVDFEKTIEAFVMGELPEEDLKERLVSHVFDHSGIDRKDYRNIPEDDESVHKWLNLWHTFLADSFKVDFGPLTTERVKRLLSELDDEETEKLLAQHRIGELGDLKGRKFGDDSDMVSAIANAALSPEERTEKMAGIFLAKWFPLIKTADLKNEKLFAAWVKEGAPGLARKLVRKAKGKNPQSDAAEDAVTHLIVEALHTARRDLLEGIGQAGDTERRKAILASRISQKIITVFSPELAAIQLELQGYVTVQTETANSFYVGFFDDLLHLMGFMMTGVCTWVERDKQVNNTSYHFGKMALKDAAGKVLGLSQVQLIKEQIQGLPRQKSEKGWSVLALPGINLHAGNIGMDPEKAVLAILEGAQKLAQDSGLQGAVIPTQGGINSNSGTVHGIIAKLVSKGWLKQVKLTGKIPLALSYKYDDVYLVQIPETAYSLQPASRDEQIRKEQQETDRRQKETSLSFSGNFGDIIYEEAGRGYAPALQTAVEQIMNEFPQAILETVKENASINESVFRIKVEPGLEASRVNKADGEIELSVGRDILYREGKAETAVLADLLAEMTASFILDDYAALKEASAANENAYFKLEAVKGLLLHKRYLEKHHKVIHKYNWNPSTYLSEKTPEETASLMSQYRTDLDRFTEGMDGIAQWNLFLNVQDDADPDFVLVNYLHLLSKTDAGGEKMEELLRTVLALDVNAQPGLARLRNVIKEFVLNGKAQIKIGKNIQEKTSFTHFDETERFNEWKETLLLSRDQNEFYTHIRQLLQAVLPASAAQLQAELSRIVDENLFDRADREAALREMIEEYLARRIGRNAYESLKKHLTASRENEDIPYFRLFGRELPEGADADEYGYLEYGRGEDQSYELTYRGEDEGVDEQEPAPEKPYDWTRGLFPFPEARSELRAGAAIEEKAFAAGGDISLSDARAREGMPLEKTYIVYIHEETFNRFPETKKIEWYKLFAMHAEAKKVIFAFYGTRDRETEPELRQFKKEFRHIVFLDQPEKFNAGERIRISVSQEGLLSGERQKLDEQQRLEKTLRKFYAVHYKKGTEKGLLAAALLLIDSGREEFIRMGQPFYEVPAGLSKTIERMFEAYLYIGTSA